MNIKISVKEIQKYLNIETSEFPKYTAALINLANQYAQGTRPKIVGQMSELIQEFTGKTLPEWEKWYLEQKPDAIRAATEKTFEMLNNLKGAMEKIDRELVEEWIRDLVIVKTFAGLRFQEAILGKGAEKTGEEYRLAKPSEEAKGIDGFIGNIPVSIKPETYRSMARLPETVNVRIIYYKKVKDGIEVDYGEIFS
jgi:hypothetical protein